MLEGLAGINPALPCGLLSIRTVAHAKAWRVKILQALGKCDPAGSWFPPSKSCALPRLAIAMIDLMAAKE